jgi:hypothetical protein
MTKSKEYEEEISAETPTDDAEDESKRELLKLIGLAAAALATTALTSSETSAQENTQKRREFTEQEILAALKKEGITNLNQLANKAAVGNARFTGCLYDKTKVIIWFNAN